MSFSFSQHAVVPQSLEQTLSILVYEVGHMVEYRHRENCYGLDGYWCMENQRKETADAISMLRYYCEQRHWDFEELLKLGEEAYLERMEDIKRYGLSTNRG